MIPKVEDLKSDVLAHKHGDIFNPPGLTNFYGCTQADFDVLGIRSMNFPPFGCSEIITGGLFVDNCYFPATGTIVNHVWYPDHIERTAEYNGLSFRSTMVLPFGIMGTLVKLEVKNTSGAERRTEFKIRFQGSVTKAVRTWNDAFPPLETGHEITPDVNRHALIYRAKNSEAFQLQGVSCPVDKLDRFGVEFSRVIGAGETISLVYVNLVGENITTILAQYDRLIANADSVITSCHDEWNEEIKAAYTPGNDRFSGSMPVLETTDKEIKKIYDMGVFGVIYFKRDNPYSVLGRTYDTLMPRYWPSVTFIWDYALSSLTHALLDPAVAKKYLLHWMAMDIHKHFGTEYLTGGPVGPWYSVNDFAITGIAKDYLRWSGDKKWLTEEVAIKSGDTVTQKTVSEFLMKYADNWKGFKTRSGLADYGGINNLLECVSTYIHEVASLNAGNVFNMRTAAEILTHLGDTKRAAAMLDEASHLVPEINKLYVDGKGYWNTRFPDGELVEVRHCYDFITILNTIADDLTIKQKNEMFEYFKRELQSPTWMRALSAGDDNAIFSTRPDHQWNGAYPAWPAQAVTGLYKIGQGDLAFKWLKGLSKSTNQGPLGQAHFVESAIDPECGASRKGSPEMQYLCDWTVSSSGSWTNIIIQSIFGVNATMFDGISAKPDFGAFDPKAELKNLNYQGKLYNVTAKGLTEV